MLQRAAPSLWIFLSTPSARRATSPLKKCSERITISIHALREEGDDRGAKLHSEKVEFLSTPSARRATRDFDSTFILHDISIHALREEGDTTFSTAPDSSMNFYPRPPRGGRHPAPAQNTGRCRNFYPRPPRGGRPASAALPASPVMISIHALREEGDPCPAWCSSCR